MILKKQNKETQALPLVRNKEARAFPVLFPRGPCFCDLYLWCSQHGTGTLRGCEWGRRTSYTIVLVSFSGDGCQWNA